jgi:hypothetical protein
VRAGELSDLLGHIRVPESPELQPDWLNDRTISAEIDQASAT